MSSSIRVRCWFLGCALMVLGCQQQAVQPTVAGACRPNTLVMCVCPGGESVGYIPCGADRTVTPCGGCETLPPLPPSVSGSASASGSALGVAGRPAMSAAAGGGSFGAAGSPASLASPAAMGCAVGEMCKVSLRGGGVKFCTRDPAAALPPACTAPGQPCGTNNAGNCVDAKPLGSPGAMFCIYSQC